MTTESLWYRFERRLFAFIMSKVKDEDIAKDLLQEVFVKIHTKLASLEDQSKIESWIFQITRNSITDHFRSTTAKSALPELTEPAEEDLFEIPHISNFRRCLDPFVNELSPKDRDIIEAVLFDGRSQIEYARERGLTYSTVKSRYQRAKLKLRESIRECCFVLTDVYGQVLETEMQFCTC